MSATQAGPGSHGRPFGFYLGLLLLMFVGSAAAAVVYVQIQSTRNAEHGAQADAAFASRAAAKQLGADVAVLKASVDQLAANPSIAQAVTHPSGCSLVFSGSAESAQGHIDILRRDGRALCSSRKRAANGELAGYAGQRWVQRAGGSKLFLAPFRDTATGRQAALYAVPGPGKTLVAAFLDLTGLGSGLHSVYSGGKPAEFLVVARDGTVVARSIDPRRWIGAPARASAAAGSSTFERRDLDGVRRIYAAAPIRGTRWRLFVGENKAAALAAGHRLRDRELAIVLASLGLILLAAIFVYRRTVSPMKRLSAAVKATAATGHATRVAVSGPAEVEQLADEINALIASVNTQEVVRRAKEEAERANEAKSRFLSHMSHELRTPLAAMLGFAELLHRDEASETKRLWSRHVLDAGRRLLQLVNELLEISRIEAGKMMLTIRPVDADKAAGDVLDLMAPLAADRGVRLERRGGAPGRAVLADPLRLNQVLINLVANAINYNRDAGTVSVSVATEGETVRFAVADTGEGIPPEKLELLFSPFERLGAEHGSVSGSGLGLAVTSGLVEAMGGRLTVASELGAGSTFTLELPAAPAATRLPSFTPGQAPSATPASTGHVLYIDDDTANLELVDGLLTNLRPGLELHTTKRGADGAQLAERERPDLLLLDLNLPDIAGEEVLRRLRARADTADVPVVILSADSTSHNVPRLLQSGADAYLTKPLNVEAFLDVVDHLLQSR